MRLKILVCLALLAPLTARADWTPSGCGTLAKPPSYELTSREAYNDAVEQVKAWQRTARAYSDCVLKAAHADQTTISRQAQNRIADIQTIAVGTQQDIYARFAAQAAAFRAAAGRLKAR